MVRARGPAVGRSRRNVDGSNLGRGLAVSGEFKSAGLPIGASFAACSRAGHLPRSCRCAGRGVPAPLVLPLGLPARHVHGCSQPARSALRPIAPAASIDWKCRCSADAGRRGGRISADDLARSLSAVQRPFYGTVDRELDRRRLLRTGCAAACAREFRVAGHLVHAVLPARRYSGSADPVSPRHSGTRVGRQTDVAISGRAART